MVLSIFNKAKVPSAFAGSDQIGSSQATRRSDDIGLRVVNNFNFAEYKKALTKYYADIRKGQNFQSVICIRPSCKWPLYDDYPEPIKLHMQNNWSPSSLVMWRRIANKEADLEEYFNVQNTRSFNEMVKRNTALAKEHANYFQLNYNTRPLYDIDDNSDNLIVIGHELASVSMVPKVPEKKIVLTCIVDFNFSSANWSQRRKTDYNNVQDYLKNELLYSPFNHGTFSRYRSHRLGKHC